MDPFILFPTRFLIIVCAARRRHNADQMVNSNLLKSVQCAVVIMHYLFLPSSVRRSSQTAIEPSSIDADFRAQDYGT